jgi:hypothetical protein
MPIAIYPHFHGRSVFKCRDFILQQFRVKIVGGIPAYDHAAALVRVLLALAPDAILRLRAVQPQFVKLTPEAFAAAKLNVPSALIAGLLAPFARG